MGKQTSSLAGTIVFVYVYENSILSTSYVLGVRQYSCYKKQNRWYEACRGGEGRNAIGERGTHTCTAPGLTGLIAGALPIAGKHWLGAVTEGVRPAVYITPVWCLF